MSERRSYNLREVRGIGRGGGERQGRRGGWGEKVSRTRERGWD